jgi:hypothetical protein
VEGIAFAQRLHHGGQQVAELVVGIHVGTEMAIPMSTAASDMMT